MLHKIEAMPFRILNLISVIVMITANIVFEILPLNGISTAQVSNAHDTILTPPGFTFSIWGIIYLWLLLGGLYQIGLFHAQKDADNPDLIYAVKSLIPVVCVIDIIWLVMWHYELLLLSLLVIVLLWIALVFLYLRLLPEIRTMKERLFLLCPISIFLAWISAASLLNLTVFIHDLSSDMFGLGMLPWSIAVLLILFAISEIFIIKYADYVFGLTSVWAFAGIITRFFSAGEESSNLMIMVVLSSFLAGMLLLSLAIRALSRHKAKLAQITSTRNMHH